MITLNDKKQSIRSRLNSDTALASAMVAAVAAQRAYHATYDDLEPWLDTQAQIKAAHLVLNRAETTAELEAITEELNALRGGDAEKASRQAHSVVGSALVTFSLALTPVVDAAEAALEVLLAQAIEDETRLFGGTYGLPVPSTLLRERVAAVQTRVADFRNSIAAAQGNPQANRGALSQVVEYFTP